MTDQLKATRFAGRVRAAGLFVSALVAAGCSPSRSVMSPRAAQGPNSGMFGWLRSEMEGVVELLAGAGVGRLLLALLAITAAMLGLSWLLRRWRRAGVAYARAFNTLSLGLQLSLLGLCAALLLRYLFGRTPLAAIAALSLVGAGFLFSVGLMARRWIAATSLVLRQVVRRGDKLIVDDTQGTVERVGIFRIVVRQEDGSLVHVPSTQLADRRFAVASPQSAFPVIVCLEFANSELSAAVLAEIDIVCKLCPYRDVTSPVSVSSEDGALTVRLRSWSESAARHAESYVRGALEARRSRPASRVLKN